MKIEYAATELHRWQDDLWDGLECQDNREITWVVDFKGGKGKTFMSKWLVAMHDAFYVDKGKQSDIIHAYQDQEYVVFDLCREKEEHFRYAMLETFKNGIAFSGKYESSTKMFPFAKVVVFSNWEPERKKLSQDRWNIFYLHPESEDLLARCEYYAIKDRC